MVHTYLLCALDLAIGPSFEAVVTGPAGTEETQALLDVLRREYLPNKVLMLKDPATATDLEKAAPFTRELHLREGRPTAYLCVGFQCTQPATDPLTLAEYLQTFTRPDSKT
jgi:uncharacterized protein YyaL (SSP411 family)